MHTYLSAQINGAPRRQADRKPPWRVALVANLKEDFDPSPEDPPDAGAEFDSRETIEQISTALESDGHWVTLLHADHTLPEALINLRPHLCFNIAEGMQGDGREAQVPALCELLGIPYTASRVVANAISLDKIQTKRIWQVLGLPTAPYNQFKSVEEIAHLSLRFPLLVKPAREGTGKGIDTGAIAENLSSLVDRASWALEKYRQPVLVEEYLPGREFTVGFLGNPGNPAHRRHPELYDSDGYHWFPILEIDTVTSISPRVYGHDAKALEIGQEGAPGYLCPADIPESLRARLIDLTRQAVEALEVCDLARVDFRVGADGDIYLMELNTLPGLNPQVSDLCLMAASEGLAYHDLIVEILYLAAERFGLPFPSKSWHSGSPAYQPVLAPNPLKVRRY
jgi:D-alanine-D-alanine ligase